MSDRKTLWTFGDVREVDCGGVTLAARAMPPPGEAWLVKDGKVVRIVNLAHEEPKP